MDKLYDHKAAEEALQKFWHNHGVYHRSQHAGPLYSIDTPPPTVSGSLHLGHIFSYTQTDIGARYKRMQGYCVFYPFGFDDNGLPTERYVEKQHNITAHNLSRSDFIKLCLEQTNVVEKQFKSLWRHIGLSVDWDACYSTIAATSRKISQESFIRLYQKGYIYRKNEPALYCTTCRTSVAQAELDDKEVPSFFNDLIFKAQDGTELVIGTTRPELLPSCVALFYHPNDKRYQAFKDQTATVPLFNFTVPILADELVDPTKGTGLVMCCTFGDKTDIVWFKKHNLHFKQAIGLDGKWVAQTGDLAGLRVHAAREKVITLLKEQGLLRHQRPITHAVNAHERCKKEIEYTVLPQWFLKILPFKENFIELADTITWYPSFMKPRYQNWVENINWDWCLSRQRFFGIPFPAWHCTSCAEVILPSLDQLPLDPQETPYKGNCPFCGGTTVPDTDVMDTWNTSSLTPYLCADLFNDNQDSYTEFFADAHQPRPIKTAKMSPFEHQSSWLPMSMRPQAHDIIRTWAFYTIIKTWMHYGTAAWKEIVISGHVLSEGKEKLSKSKENASLTPQVLLERYPADALRYWTASVSLGQDVPFSENQIKIGQRLITKLWNAFKFLHEHVTTKPEQSEELGILNEWLLHQATRCFNQYQHAFEQHESGTALHHVEQFFWHDFCDNYLELTKDQLFNPHAYAAHEVDATRWTLYTVGLRILQFYAPYLPYITDAIYQHVYRVHEAIISIHMTKFESAQLPYEYPNSARLMQQIIYIASTVRKLKTERQLSLKVSITSLTLPACYRNILTKHEQLIKGITRTEVIQYEEQVPPTATMHEVEGLWHAEIALAE
jgi:valyl-tRNA synthetase